MSKFAKCSNTEPNTCFEASKAHIFIGRCGLSLHLLYTSERRARPPKAACTRMAKGPRSSHSPVFREPSCDDPEKVEVEDGVGDGITEGAKVSTRVGVEEAMMVAIWKAAVKDESITIDVKVLNRRVLQIVAAWSGNMEIEVPRWVYAKPRWSFETN